MFLFQDTLVVIENLKKQQYNELEELLELHVQFIKILYKKMKHKNSK